MKVWELADGCFWGWNRYPECLLQSSSDCKWKQYAIRNLTQENFVGKWFKWKLKDLIIPPGGENCMYYSLRLCFSLLGFLSSWRWNFPEGMTLKNNSATPLLDHSPRRAEMWVTIQAVNQLKKAVQLSLTKEPWTHVVRMKNCCSQNCSPSHHDITLHNHSLVSLILIYVPWIQPFDCGVCLVALTEKLELQGKIWKRKPFGYIWSCIVFFFFSLPSLTIYVVV